MFIQNYMIILHIFMQSEIFKYDRFFFIKNKNFFFLLFLSFYYGYFYELHVF
jgi:hypothetical protein